VHSGRAGSDHDPIDGEFTDIFFDQVLSGVGAEITIVPGYLHPRKGTGKRSEFTTIDCGSDVRATVTDVNADLLHNQISNVKISRECGIK
jgi:hypothetical protein